LMDAHCFRLQRSQEVNADARSLLCLPWLLCLSFDLGNLVEFSKSSQTKMGMVVLTV
jgi:hypothetical protein